MTGAWEVREGDAVERLREMAEGSVDAVVCDPPYGLEFMGKDWDRLGAQRPAQPGEPAFSDVDNPYGRGKVRYGGSASYGANAAASGRAQQAWHEAWAREALRVLKPGGHLLAFGGTRTYHRLACAVEDAGFEIRDEVLSIFEATDAGRRFLASLTPEQIAALDKLGGGPLAWLYGSGFPKSLDVGKAIDKAAGAEREVVGRRTDGRYGYGFSGDARRAQGAVAHEYSAGWVGDPAELTAPATPEAERWDGWGTALKPAHEPIVVARKPLAGTVAANVLAHGTGAVNVDGCRVGFAGVADERESKDKNRHADFGSGPSVHSVFGQDHRPVAERTGNYDPPGRWPANVVLSHAEGCVLVGRRPARSNGHFPAARGASGYGSAVEGSTGGGLKGQDGLEERRFDGELADVWACVPGCPVRMLDDQSGVSMSSGRRGGTPESTGIYGGSFPRGDGREAGFGDRGGASRFFYCAKASRAERNAGLEGRNVHPTVKSLDLMRWLVRLVTPPGGLVLDPFLGSGSTGCAAVLEGFRFVGVERDREYVAIARARIEFWAAQPAGLPVKAALRGRRRRARESGQIGLDF